MEGFIKIKFKTDYFPRKKGEAVDLETKLANHYLSIGVAEIPCSGCEDKPCSECEKLIKADSEANKTDVTTTNATETAETPKEVKQTKPKKK